MADDFQIPREGMQRSGRLVPPVTTAGEEFSEKVVDGHPAMSVPKVIYTYIYVYIYRHKKFKSKKS